MSVNRITFSQVSQALGDIEVYDIMNAIRNSSSDSFQRYVPLANAKNVAEVGDGVLVSQSLQNEFITSLVDRIGRIVMRKVTLQNQLKPFKSGNMEYGRMIEEVFIDLCKENGYDPEKSETEVFKREIPDTKTIFHEENRRGFFKQTIQQISLKKAFLSWDNFGEFVAGVFNAMYNSDQVAEYNYMMFLIDNYFSKGLFKVEKVNAPVDVTTTTELVKSIRKYAGKMTLMSGSRNYNAAAVHTVSDMDNLQLIITADLQAEMDVDVLSKAFNMDKTDFLGHVTVVDEFATPGLEAVLVDRNWFMVFDTHFSMEAIWNPQGLYWNYFLHHWQILSTSRFAQAVAFVSGEVDNVTNIIIDPIKSSIYSGNSMEFTGYVRTTVDGDYPIAWSVEGLGGTAIAEGTSIDDKGILTVGATQSGELVVKATVTDGEATKESTAVVKVLQSN